MFSDRIVASDAFLDMPLSAQALYYHLGMNADNDGFVQPKKVMRMVGAANDDLQILIAKRFIIVFETGVAVVKHWWINNTKRVDRHVPTTYETELALLELKDSKAYTLTAAYRAQITDVGNQMATNRQPGDNQRLPQIHVQSHVHVQDQVQSQVHVLSAAEPTVSEPTVRPERIPTQQITEMMELWETVVGMKLGNETGNRKAIAALLRAHSHDELERMVQGCKFALDDQFAPRISDFVDLKKKWNALIVWGKKKGTTNANSRF